MTLLAGFAALLSRYSGAEEIVVGTPTANRTRAEVEGLIGFFVNTLVLRVNVHPVMPLAEFLQHVKETTLGAYDHQDVPFEQIVEAVRPQRSLSRHPIFQVSFALRNAPGAEFRAAGLSGTVSETTNGTAKFDLLLDLEERGERLEGNLSYATDLFERRTIERWAACFDVLLRSLISARDANVGDLAIVAAAERRLILEDFNATAASYPLHKRIHELFEEQVERTPHAVAVVCGEEHLTYRQLNGKANRLAHFLREHGAGPDRFVGVCMARSTEMMIALLGILKSGAAYVPLDPNYPRDRLEFMLEDTQPLAVLTQERFRAMLPEAATSIAVDTRWSDIESRPAHAPVRVAGEDSSNLAYIIYTSGSTGRPKGVAIEHRNTVNFLCWAQSAMSGDIFEETLASTSLNFDLSVYECFAPLITGGMVRVVRDALALLESSRPGVTLINTVPSAIAAVLSSGAIPTSTKVVNLAGEALRGELVERIFAHSSVDYVCNLYGPSETTTYSTWVCMPRDAGFIDSIGRPVANTQIYILEKNRQVAPIGVVGEIYIGGAGVARGYLHRPDITSERFLRDTFSADPQARMYKTGDLGRWRADGTIEYLGRNDHQVKIRGFRVELGEIETRLVRHTDVAQAVVSAREDIPGEKRLVAYVVPSAAGVTVDVDELRAHLKMELPEHMVPGAFVVLQSLPLTPNGKLDRGALPTPELGAYATRLYEAPQGDVEEILASIWQALLRVERVGRQDNFFELGGHSLLIVQLMERLRRFGLATEMRRVFDNPTLAGLAQALVSSTAEKSVVPLNLIPSDATELTPEMLPLIALDDTQIAAIVATVPGGAANIQDIYPLAPLQEGILFHHLFDEGGDTYLLPMTLRVVDRARLDEMVAALQSVIDRHDVLRSGVLWEGLPRPVQVVYRSATLPVVETSLRDDVEPLQQINEWMKPERQRIDLRQAPLLRLQVAPNPYGPEWYVLLQLHHMMIDHVALEAVTAEVVAELEHHARAFPPSDPYRNHVAQALAYASKHDAEAFFKQKLGDVDEPTAPFGLLDVHGDGTHIGEAHEPLEAALALQIRGLARRFGVSAATLFHVAFGMVVAQTSARDDVVFGSVLLGRLQSTAGARRTLGMFINTLPLRLRLRSVSALDAVVQTQRELVELLGHEQASLAMAQRCSGITGSAPLFSALFNYRHSVPNVEAEWSSAQGIEIIARQERTNYPITLSVDDLGTDFALLAQTDSSIDPKRVIGYVRTAIHALAEALRDAPHVPLLALSILTESERVTVTEGLNSTRVEYQGEQLIHRLFEAQVRRTPAQIAVVHDGVELSYAELNARANRLARYLKHHGVGPGGLVAICVDRGVDMVAALLATLKAGAAYLPLDPNYPPERLTHMLTDGAPQIVLTQRALAAHLPAGIVQATVIEQLRPALLIEREDDLADAEVGSTPDDFLYVIYTSGSTGRPKGTAMPHRAMSNLLRWHADALALQPGERVLQFAALSFDVAFQEIFSTLSGGGTLVLLTEEVRRDARALTDLIDRERVQRLFVPPLMLQAIAESVGDGGSMPRHLKDVITAGEQLRVSQEIVEFFARTTQARLHNHYGPTETHVVTALTLSGDASRWPALPTIGAPIANCRIYILDERGQLAPRGIAGEVYIAGANVAHGYLHRPDMTAQRFMPDPFGAPDERMYRTGDRGRWTDDGSIEYLGRNDDQVKIRGYRIELGEIESRLARHEQLREVAVVAREASAGGKSLVAYVVPAHETRPSVEDLRAFVKGALPEYMVPSAFVFLDRLPLTPSGKLDRRALPAPDSDAYASSNYQAPEGATELALAEIWRELLAIERVGRQDDFFELGGHSLLALKALVRINQTFHCLLKVRDVYRSPKLSELAARISGHVEHDEWVDLAIEAKLPDDIVPASHAPRMPAQAILLTGATGFVGRFLLAQLLHETDATIYCMVRATSKSEAADRIKRTLLKWDLWSESHAERIVAVVGNLQAARLGMDELQYRMLCEEVDCIYHCATSMNHLETYAMAKAANVDASRDLIRMATRGRPKLINYVSTLGTFGASATESARFVDETTPIDGERHLHSSGYTASKWVGEKLFLMAAERGIPCNVFRLGLVWADTIAGRFDELQHLYRVMKTCLLTGVGISDFRYPMPPTPVDYVARSVVFLGNRYATGGGVFHITSSAQAVQKVFEACRELTGEPGELLPYYDWVRRIKLLHEQGRELPAVPLIESAFNMERSAFEEQQRNLRSAVNISFDAARTHRELERAGIVAPILNEQLLAICLQGLARWDPDLRDAGWNCDSRAVFSAWMPPASGVIASENRHGSM
ncbi:MAG TPA: amino acid adenylation domain-containing protein [Steroidobacter sp.]